MIIVIIMIICIITIRKAPLVPREKERDGRGGGCQEQSSRPTSGDMIYQPDQNNLRVKEETEQHLFWSTEAVQRSKEGQS